jgi:xanthosine utilization system XapX-like protein
MSKKTGAAVVIVLLGVLGIYNGVVTIPVSRALSDETGVTMVAYRRWLVSPGTIVVDVWKMDGTAAMVDVDRNLFKAAEALKDQSYSNVVLAYRGRGRFLLDGAHFKTIGEERSYQNPIYMVRTLTEHIDNMDGRPAFGTWEGGWLGVLGKQMEDQGEFHAQWYAREALGVPAGTKLVQ